ncbi:MAG TPA: alpha/beta hydrolase [Acidimicrobiales bacterium]|nr:alpha/beta hydrolase [Acidimicrobiales bacterium]
MSLGTVGENLTRRRTVLVVAVTLAGAGAVAATAYGRTGQAHRPAPAVRPAPTTARAAAVPPRPGPPTTTLPGPSTPPAPAAGTSTTVALPAPPPLGWSPCGAGRQCSTLVVPVDYGRPGAAQIGIALRRRPASDPAHRIGSLVLNPGGPGESGIAKLDTDVALLPADVLARFDVVAFDPRGIGGSDPLHCAGDTYAGPTPDPDPQTADAQRVLLDADRAYADACGRAGGDLLAHLGTADVARDLDELRAALGDARLTYLGLSYGTFLGSQYAGMFPTHVRAMVLDGALDPSLPTDALANAQAQGFERSLAAFLSWWRPDGGGRAAFDAVVTSVRARPLRVGARQVGPAELYTGVFGTLYARSFWPSLARALAAAAAGNGAPVLGLFDGYERTGDPTFDTDTNNAVNCIDHPVPRDPGAFPARAAAAGAAAPDFGPLFAWGGLMCAVWPVPDSALRVPAPVHAPGSPPIVVVGTTGDPATPYAWAQSLASQLSQGVLLTRVGDDHVALFYSACVRNWAGAYLVGLQPPPPGTVCRG